jgi:hypothetical protein
LGDGHHSALVTQESHARGAVARPDPYRHRPEDQVVELARRDFLKHAGILIYQDCPYRGERAAGCGEQLGWNPLGSGNWDARSEELRKYMADSMWLGGPPPAAMMGTIADCTLRTCKPLADELTRRGLYAPASSEWVWSADGHCSVRTPQPEPSSKH